MPSASRKMAFLREVMVIVAEAGRVIVGARATAASVSVAGSVTSTGLVERCLATVTAMIAAAKARAISFVERPVRCGMRVSFISSAWLPGAALAAPGQAIGHRGCARL